MAFSADYECGTNGLNFMHDFSTDSGNIFKAIYKPAELMYPRRMEFTTREAHENKKGRGPDGPWPFYC